MSQRLQKQKELVSPAKPVRSDLGRSLAILREAENGSIVGTRAGFKTKLYKPNQFVGKNKLRHIETAQKAARQRNTNRVLTSKPFFS